MIFEIVKAVLFGTIPVATFTFFILQWSIASGRMKAFDSKESPREQYVAHAKAQKEAAKSAKKNAVKSTSERLVFSKRKGGDILHSKIMSFGGGFYGTMAVMTYLIIEVAEIGGFLGKIVDPGNWILSIGFDLIVGFIVNSITNLIAAFIWFDTLTNYVPVNIGWIWLAAAYLGYLAGIKITSQFGDAMWIHIEKTSTRFSTWIKTKN